MKCPMCGYDNREDVPYCSMCQGSFTKKVEPAPWMKRRPLHQVLDADRRDPPVYSEREAAYAQGSISQSGETLTSASEIISDSADRLVLS